MEAVESEADEVSYKGGRGTSFKLRATSFQLRGMNYELQASSYEG